MVDYSKFGAMVGRTVTGVIVKESDTHNPHSQVFLIFSDGNYSELFSFTKISPAKPWPGGAEEVRNYMPEHRKIIYELFLNEVDR